MARSKRSRVRRNRRRLQAAMADNKANTIQRDPCALPAKMRGGAGQHTDKKKEAARKACRKPVRSWSASGDARLRSTPLAVLPRRAPPAV